MFGKILIYSGIALIAISILRIIRGFIPKSFFRKKVELRIWQISFFIIGELLIVVGLIVIIYWQRGFVQLKWLQCPELEIPFA